MKIYFLYVLKGLFFSLIFISCQDSTSNLKLNKNNSVTNAHYQCSMKCEGEKMYDKPGSCPVCNMNLQKVEAKQEHHNHDSTHSNH